MGKRGEQEDRAIALYAEGKEIPEISQLLGVSETSLRKWKKHAGAEWAEARAAVRKSYIGSFEEVGARLRRSREISDRLTGDLLHQGNMGIVINETLRSMMFDILNQVSTADIDPEMMGATIKQINQLTLTLQRAEAAANLNLKREAEIRKQTLESAVKVVEEVAARKKSGLSDEAANEIRKKILGIGA